MVETVAWYELEPGFAANFHLNEAGNYFGKTGSSRDISNEIDLAHLIKLRSQADAIVVGGETARIEGYKPSTRFETYVFTSLPTHTELRPLKFSGDAELSDRLSELKALHNRVLSECGPSLLNQFLKLGEIDQLFLTVTFEGKPDPLAVEDIAKSVLALDRYEIARYEPIQNSALTMWRRA
jgi:riboflavin biosynthesis pyrimidine reductase